MSIKLAEALLRRKELNLKVGQLHRLTDEKLYETKIERTRVTDSLDNIIAKVPRFEIGQLTEEYDYYASALRRLDAAIQQANWTIEVDIADSCMEPYKRS